MSVEIRFVSTLVKPASRSICLAKLLAPHGAEPGATLRERHRHAWNVEIEYIEGASGWSMLSSTLLEPPTSTHRNTPPGRNARAMFRSTLGGSAVALATADVTYIDTRFHAVDETVGQRQDAVDEAGVVKRGAVFRHELLEPREARVGNTTTVAEAADDVVFDAAQQRFELRHDGHVVRACGRRPAAGVRYAACSGGSR
jgi:hypothetical protein